jgi:hypothetical protein
MQFTVDIDLAIVGIVLGLVAVLMAAPPLVQMLYGRLAWNLPLTNLPAPTASSFYHHQEPRDQKPINAEPRHRTGDWQCPRSL